MADSSMALRLEALPARALISVRTEPRADSHWLGEALGVPWQPQPMTLHHAQGLRWWSTAPGVWLIDGSAEDEEKIYRAINAASQARIAMVTVVSDALGAIGLSGSGSALIDLFERAGPVGSEVLAGRCVATRLGALAITMFEWPARSGRDAAAIRQIELRVERPLLGSLTQWLMQLGARG